MNLHGMTVQPPRLLSPLEPAGPKFWRPGVAFLAVYLALNLLTEWYDLDRLGITLWSPDNALSLVVLIESVMFAPFVFIGAVLVDLFVAGVRRSVSVTMTADLLLTLVYVSLALFVRKRIKFNLKQIRLANAVAFLIFIPAGRHPLIVFILCSAVFLRCALN